MHRIVAGLQHAQHSQYNRVCERPNDSADSQYPQHSVRSRAIQSSFSPSSASEYALAYVRQVDWLGHHDESHDPENHQVARCQSLQQLDSQEV